MPSSKGHTIGVLAGWQYYWTATPLSYLEPIYRGIRQAAADSGCNLLLGCGMGPSAMATDPLRPAWPVLSTETDFIPIGPWNTDGLIAVNPLHTQARSRYLQDLIAVGHPVLFIASGEPGPTIVADNAAGIGAAMQHLVGHGHRRIAFIAGSPEDLAGDTGARLAAYRTALLRHGFEHDERIVAYGRHIYAGGYEAMRQIMATGATFTAVLASNDESALGALQALNERGLKVPDDVAMIGFDDRPESAVQEPALTSVSVPLFEMGYRAVEQLLFRIERPAVLGDTVKVAAHLVLRESCGCGRTGAPHQRAEPGISLAGEPEEIRSLRRRLTAALIDSVEYENPSALPDMIEAILWQTSKGWDDAAIWQATSAIVRDELPALIDRWSEAARHEKARSLLEEARSVIAAAIWRRHRRYVVDQRWTFDRIGQLTAHLLNALDERQIYDVLARHLPEMGINFAAVVYFEPEGDDQVAVGELRMITPHSTAAGCFACREFPPDGMLPAGQPFSLALLPLVSPRGQLGFVAFDSDQLDLYGAIVQQMAAALTTAQLYREATEGRRLAEEANQMKSRFLSTVSHELRTPLNMIVGLGEILLRDSDRGDVPLPPSARTDIERLNANAQHLGRLIGDVLDLASSDAGQLRLSNGYVDLGQTLHIVAETGRRLAADKGLGWRAVLPKSGPWVWGDRTRLSQVTLNLISNAIKFTMKGEVSLTVEPGPESVTVIVHDTGLGIPLEEQGAIFDEFRRSERSITRGYGGLGLGLAVCRRLVELHGGTIGVASTGLEGEGSTFFFRLPTAERPAVPAAAAVATAPDDTVLVLTTTPAANVRLREHLEQRGFEVHLALIDQPSQWQAQLLTLPPSAVVLDVSVASEQGWQVLKTTKTNPATQGIPVLFYSIFQNSGSVLELDYLTKPIELAELTRALDQHWLAVEADASQRAFLVVDDDPETLEMHARIVQARSSSAHVLKARNGLEALEVLRNEHIDLVLLDLIMPEMDGFAVLEAMRDHDATRNIPVIVVTGQTLTEAEMVRLNQGVTKVLSKGLFSFDETLAHLDAALARRRELSMEAQRLVRQAMAYLHEHYTEPISRQELADHVGLSDDYLTSCFHKEMGLTPVAYLNRYRIQQAKHLLRNTHRSITEIAFDLGFSSSSYFSRVFHRETGMSPAAYRRM